MAFFKENKRIETDEEYRNRKMRLASTNFSIPLFLVVIVFLTSIMGVLASFNGFLNFIQSLLVNKVTEEIITRFCIQGIIFCTSLASIFVTPVIGKTILKKIEERDKYLLYFIHENKLKKRKFVLKKEPIIQLIPTLQAVEKISLQQLKDIVTQLKEEPKEDKEKELIKK